MTSGGPEDRTRFIAMFIYDQTFQYQAAWLWLCHSVGVISNHRWTDRFWLLRISREHVYYAAR